MITIASILSMNPEVLVIDEPTLGMDFRGRESVMALIDRLNQLGKTIVIITHDMKVVASHSNRVLVLSEGELILDCKTTKLFKDHDEVLSRASLKPPERILLAREMGVEDLIHDGTIENLSEKVREMLARVL